MITELTNNWFSSNKLLVPDDLYVFVKVYAPWCGWCKKTNEEYSKLSIKYLNNPKVLIAQLDGDKYKKIRGDLNVATFPTFLLFKGRDIVVEYDKTGERTAKNFSIFIDTVIRMNK